MERIRVDHSVVKKLGHWTTSHTIDVRARFGAAVLDLRSAQIPEGDVEIHLLVDRGMVKLLVPDGTVIDTEDLEWTGRGRVKDWTGAPSPDGRRIRLSGFVRNSEIRVHRGGIAILSALFSRAFWEDCVRAHRTGTPPTVLDPSVQ
jgi:hypothetical protein